MSKTLENVKIRTSDITGAVLISNEGLPILTPKSQKIDENMVAAICATLVNIGERVTESLNKGIFNLLFISGKEGYVIISRVNQEMLLSILAKQGARIGVVLYEIEKTKEELNKIVTAAA